MEVNAGEETRQHQQPEDYRCHILHINTPEGSVSLPPHALYLYYGKDDSWAKQGNKPQIMWFLGLHCPIHDHQWCTAFVKKNRWKISFGQRERKAADGGMEDA